MAQPAPGGSAVASQWWAPGEDRPLPAYVEYANASGRLGILNASGAVATDGHPFFEAIGTNGRACVSCHQPADGMSLALSSIVQRWHDSKGADPIFAAIDGMDCPNRPPADPASHSLLLERGLFRIALPWPPVDAAGRRITPEFTLEVVRDPTGCNTHPVYGVAGERHEVSVYRRPRPAANLRYVASSRFGVTPFIGKTGMLSAVDPDTGRPVNMNMMADAREPTLKTQAQSAAHGHLEVAQPLSPEQLDRIRDFELQLYAAAGVLERSRRLERARRPFGSRSSRDGGRRRRRARQQHDALRHSDGRQMGRPARKRRRRATRAQCVPQLRAARPRRVLLPDVLDPRCDAHQYGRSRQSDQTHLRDLSRHAHDGHGHGQRLDGSRDHEPSLGARAAREPVGRRSGPSCRCSRSRAATICRRIRFSAARSTRRTPAAR